MLLADLFEVDQQQYMSKDGVCNQISRTFGCHPCKTASQITNDTRLTAFATSLPPGRPKTGRVAWCPTKLEVGQRQEVGGLGYTVDDGSFWKQ